MSFVNHVNKDVTDPLWMSHCPNRIIMSAELLPMVINCALITLSRWHTCVHTRFAHGGLLNLTVTSSNSRSQVKPQITTMGQCEHFWDCFFYYRVSAAAALPTVARLSARLFVLRFYAQLYLTFKRRILLNFSLWSTSLMHCDRKFLEELYRTCHLWFSHAFQQLYRTGCLLKHVEMYMDL